MRKATSKYTHFSKNERNEISVLLKKGYSERDIAYALRRDPSSVSREINKNSVNGQYDPQKAQHKAYENALGLIREYIPKKKSLSDYSQEEIDAIVDTINNTPRKCLGFRTPKEVFEKQYLSKFKPVSVALGGIMYVSRSSHIIARR